jgi:hypothetical protein
MRDLSKILFFLLLLEVCGSRAQNAPVSTIQQLVTTEATITLPITATGINNIGSCNLQILYDAEKLACNAVTASTEMAGGIASNLEMPGVITFGWYTWPGVTLADNSVIFVLEFSRVAFGASDISWNINYPDRQWSDGNSIVLNDLPFEDYYVNGAVTFIAGDAPVIMAPEISACPGELIDVQVSITNFIGIGAFQLTFGFDENAISFQSYSNISGFPGFSVENINPGILVIEGLSTSASGVTLQNNATLFCLQFQVEGANSDFTWFDDGPSCEFMGPSPNYPVLNDEPKATFYTDGTFNSYMPPLILNQPISSDTIVAGAGTATFDVLAGGSVLNFQWQEYITSWSDLAEGELYQGVQTSTLAIINPPVEMDGYSYRAIVSGICDPPAVTDGMAILHVTTVTTIDHLQGDSESNSSLGLLASPNPFCGNLSLSYNSPIDGDMEIVIKSLHGEIKARPRKKIARKGRHHISMQTNDFLPGVYMAILTVSNASMRLEGVVKIICINTKSQ